MNTKWVAVSRIVGREPWEISNSRAIPGGTIRAEFLSGFQIELQTIAMTVSSGEFFCRK